MGYNLNFGERADLILLRTMLSTGTATWTGYEGQGATISFGDNAHPDADAPQGSDVEIADLGLAIPYTLIDADSFVKTAAFIGDQAGANLDHDAARIAQNSGRERLAHGIQLGNRFRDSETSP